MNKKAVIILISLLSASSVFAQTAGHLSRSKFRRDPFVPLVDDKGELRELQDLFRPQFDMLPIAINLKGIVWDEKNPIAVINNKVLSQGEDLGGGVIVETIEENRVILNYEGELFPVPLRKKGAGK
ncbi:general secretion pathway protein GspB [Candidatus Omnitrophota bacterium]